MSAGETPPTRLDGSQPHTASGALAFAVYFVAALDWSIATNDPYLIRQVSTLACTGCAKYSESMTALSSAGGYSTGARITATGFSLVETDSRVVAEFTVAVTLVQTTQVVVASVGAAAATHVDDGTVQMVFLHLGWVDGDWHVIEIGGP